MDQNKVDRTLSLTPPSEMPMQQRIGMGMAGLGLVLMLIAFLGFGAGSTIVLGFAVTFLAAAAILVTQNENKVTFGAAIFGGLGVLSVGMLLLKNSLSTGTGTTVLGFSMLVLIVVGLLVYYFGKFGSGPAGIRNDGLFHAEGTKKQGGIAWLLTILFTGFYVVLYWFPENLHGLVAAVDPICFALTGNHSIPGFTNLNGGASYYNQWFLYGLTYTVLVLVMGIRYMLKYRHNRYQLVRTGSVTFFQLVLAFLLPAFFELMQGKGAGIYSHYFSYFWPLDYDALFPDFINGSMEKGLWGKFIVYWGLIMSFVAVPVLTYFFGKRWYCSFVCGCGGLAETAGDHFRHLSDKSLKAWKFERISIYSVLALITLTTVLLLVDKYGFDIMSDQLGKDIKNGYAFLIGSTFAGVVGTGFYPILGSRVWCRFGCPQAAILGIIQKYFSRFRITTNGGQCISCGNCSTYCEMGIDVKWYAQRGQNIVRASCVGCGVCSAVCPRGVLNLENGPTEGRINEGGPIGISGGRVVVKND